MPYIATHDRSGCDCNKHAGQWKSTSVQTSWKYLLRRWKRRVFLVTANFMSNITSIRTSFFIPILEFNLYCTKHQSIHYMNIDHTLCSHLHVRYVTTTLLSLRCIQWKWWCCRCKNINQVPLSDTHITHIYAVVKPTCLKYAVYVQICTAWIIH